MQEREAAGPIDEIDHNEWKVCEVNLFGAFYSASWASGIMKVQKMDALFSPHHFGLFGVPNRSLCCSKVGYCWPNKINGYGIRRLWRTCECHLPRRCERVE